MQQEKTEITHADSYIEKLWTETEMHDLKPQHDGFWFISLYVWEQEWWLKIGYSGGKGPKMLGIKDKE